jgi:hypothetical protein
MCWPRVGEANPLFSVGITLCRCTATARLSMPLNDRGISDYAWMCQFIECFTLLTTPLKCSIILLLPSDLSYKFWIPHFVLLIIHWQWGTVENQTLRQKRRLQFSYCEISISISRLSPDMTNYRVCYMSDTAGAARGKGAAYPSGAPELIPGFEWGSCYSIFSFVCCYVDHRLCVVISFILAMVLSVLRFLMFWMPPWYVQLFFM